jgi:hypothetical protein
VQEASTQCRSTNEEKSGQEEEFVQNSGIAMRSLGNTFG